MSTTPADTQSRQGFIELLEEAFKLSNTEFARAYYLFATAKLNETYNSGEIYARYPQLTDEKTFREIKALYDQNPEDEAEGIRKVLESKAQGYASLVLSCNGDAKAAATLLMIEKIEDIVTTQVEAIKNLKIDKITVWDGGAGGNGNGKGSSTANFVSSLIKSLPPLQDVAEMAGVELPSYLGRTVEEKPVVKPIKAEDGDFAERKPSEAKVSAGAGNSEDYPEAHSPHHS